MASARKKSRSKGPSVSHRRVNGQHFAICVRNDGYAASLELRKLYPVLDDPFADAHGMIRVVDESGEDYLFPDVYFVRVELPRTVERVLRKIA